MFQVRFTASFEAWLVNLRDRQGRNIILSRIDRAVCGHLGDIRSVGSGVSELRIHHGPGYRVYLTRQGQDVLLLLVGGDKSTQARDIELAIRLKNEAEGT
jgi:putative addiction module killer protein